MITLSLRASSLPLAFRCAGSVRPAEVPIDSSSPESRLGTCAHDALRALAEGGSVDWDNLPALAARHDVAEHEEELRMLCAMATKMWPRVADTFRGALSEVELSAEVRPGVQLTGHVDLYAVTDTVARAADWKTGRKDADYRHQMKAYGALILLDDPSLAEVTITVLWVRDQDIQNYTMTRNDMKSWVASLLREVADWDGTFRPGHYCDHCRRSHECRAANALVRRDVAALLDCAQDDADAIARLAPARALTLYRQAKRAKDAAERVQAAFRLAIERSGDIVSDGDGRLTLESEQRRELKPLEAWPVLESAGMGDEDFAQVVDLPISRVEKVIAKKAGKGHGAKAIRALNERLNAANAIETHEIKKLREKV